MSTVDRRKLGAFREPILQLLNRDPSKRPSMPDFYNQCNSVFSSSTTYEDITKNYLHSGWATESPTAGQFFEARTNITETMMRNDRSSTLFRG